MLYIDKRNKPEEKLIKRNQNAALLMFYQLSVSFRGFFWYRESIGRD